MLLAFDIGNTNITLGLYDGEVLVFTARLATDPRRTADQYAIDIKDILTLHGCNYKYIEDAVISSVVPSVGSAVSRAVSMLCDIVPLSLAPGVKTGLNIKAENPKEVGADIIVNSVSAYSKYGGPIVVIDFGTATTFDVITENGELLGVVIAPGIKTSLEGLATKTAQLPMIELEAPKTVIGKNTRHCMQAGIVFGFAGLVENIINKIKGELGLDKITVVATGGMGEVLAKEVSSITIFDRTLTLDGLRYIYDLNVNKDNK